MTSLYRYFDAADRLLYIGIATNPFSRAGQHALGNLPDIIIPRSYYSEHMRMAAESVGCLCGEDDDGIAFWVPDPVPAIQAASLSHG